MKKGGYGVRVIQPEQLPATVLDPEGEERPSDEQDLMNLGLFRARDGDTTFATVEPFPDGRGQHKDDSALPGLLLARGRDRYREISKERRGEVLHARVIRHVAPKQSLRHLVNKNDDPRRLRAAVAVHGVGPRSPEHQEPALRALAAARELVARSEAVELVVLMNEVQDGDVVISDLHPPMRFAGERQ